MKYHIPAPDVRVGRKITKLVPVDEKTAQKIKESKDLPIVFSFKYYDRKHALFNLGGTCLPWFASLADVLKDLSCTTVSELMTSKRTRFKPHPIEWEKVNAKFDFDQSWLDQHECTEIYISKAKGRIHGFIVGNYFYIIWLDPHHNLWPVHGGKSFGGVKIFEALPTCEEVLTKQIRDLEEKLQSAQQFYDEMCADCQHNHEDSSSQ